MHSPYFCLNKYQMPWKQVTFVWGRTLTYCSKNDIPQLPNFWKLTNPAPTISNTVSFLKNHLFLLVMMAHISLQIPTALEPLNFWLFYGELFNRQWQATFSQSYRPAWARRIQHIFFWLRILTLAGVAHLNVVWNKNRRSRGIASKGILKIRSPQFIYNASCYAQI